MRKLIFIGKLVTICLLLFLILATGFLYFGAEGITKQVVQSLQENIQSESSFSDVKLELIQHFPYVSVDANEVTISGTNGSQFLHKGKLSLLMNPISLLKGEVAIKGMKLSNAEVAITRNKDGYNYQVFGSTENSSSVGPSFIIDKAELENISLSYQDKVNHQEYDVIINNGNLSGTFNSDKLVFEIKASGNSDQLNISGQEYMQNRPFKIDGKMQINLSHKYYVFENLKVKSENIHSTINGQIRDWAQHQSFDLSIDIEKADILTLRKSLPKEYAKYLNKVNMGGHLKGVAKITGRSSSRENPKVEVNLALVNGSIAGFSNETGITDLQSSIYFTNGGARNASSSQVDFKSINGTYQGKSIAGEASIKNFSFPALNASIKGGFPITILNGFIPEEKGQFTKGVVSLENLQLEDYWIEFNSPSRLINEMNFNAQIKGVHFSYKDNMYSFPSGQIQLSESGLILNELLIHKGKSKIEIEGELKDISQAVEFQNLSAINFDLKIQAVKLKIGDFIETDKWAEAAKNGTAQFASNKEINFPQGNFSFISESLEWDKRFFKHVTFNASTTNSSVVGTTSFETCDGKLESNIELVKGKGYNISINTKFDKINLTTAFKQWNSFGQKIISSKNISGKANGYLSMYIPINNRGFIQMKQIDGAIALEIKKGELNDFDMLQKFGKFVHSEDLENIRFNLIRNYIAIKGGNVFIPSMFLQSNAANLELNGIHGLNQQILYNLKVNAGQILTNKIKKHNRKLQPIPAQKDGFFNLYYTIFGNTESFQYESNKLAVQSSFDQSEKIKNNTFEKLRLSFPSIPDWAAPKNWEDIPEYNLEEESEEVQFLEEIKG